MGSLRRFLDKYYIYNIFVILSFWIMRPFLVSDPRHSNLFAVTPYNSGSLLSGLSKEWSILVVTCFTILVKARRAKTIDAVVHSALLYFRAAVLVLYFFIGWLYFLAYGCLLLFGLVAVSLPVDKGVPFLTPSTLEVEVMNCGVNEFLIVEFLATWSPPCVEFAHIFSDLRLKYESAALKFYRIDVGRYPNFGEKYSIDTSGSSTQIPSLIVFERGKEIHRVPRILSNDKVKPFSFTMKAIEEAFDLKSLHERSLAKRKAE